MSDEKQSGVPTPKSVLELLKDYKELIGFIAGEVASLLGGGVPVFQGSVQLRWLKALAQ
jgi:hypothetical protein